MVLTASIIVATRSRFEQAKQRVVIKEKKKVSKQRHLVTILTIGVKPLCIRRGVIVFTTYKANYL